MKSTHPSAQDCSSQEPPGFHCRCVGGGTTQREVGLERGPRRFLLETLRCQGTCHCGAEGKDTRPRCSVQSHLLPVAPGASGGTTEARRQECEGQIQTSNFVARTRDTPDGCVSGRTVQAERQ